MGKILVECSSCGMHNPQQYVQCISCGNTIPTNAKRIVVDEASTDTPDKKKRSYFKLLLPLLIISALLFGFYMCFKKQIEYNAKLEKKTVALFVKAEYVNESLLKKGADVANQYVYFKVYGFTVGGIFLFFVLFRLIFFYKKMRVSQDYFKNLAITDELTGLYTHRFLMLTLKKEFKKAKRSGKPLSFAITDIDKFKSFNDTYGHEVGNVVLKMFAQVMRDTFRDSSLMRGGDILARYGGEEFCVVFPFTSVKGAYAACERFREVLSRTVVPNLTNVNVTVSIGIAAIPDMKNISSVEELIKKADKALYHAKENGRNKVSIYDLSMED